MRHLCILLSSLLLAATASGDVLAPCESAQAVAGIGSPPENPRRTVYLGDYATVWVCHADAFLAEAEAREEKVTLYVNGVDTHNEPVAVDDATGAIRFVLDRNEENKKLWSLLLYSPLLYPEEEIVLGIGKGGDRPLPRVKGANTRLTFRKLWIDFTTWLWLALLAAVVVMLIIYSRRTDLLRDGPALGGIRQPYSLARTQMAWWFILVVIGYVFIWLVTGDGDTIPVSLLGLLGISAATALAAVAVSPPTGRAATMRKMIEDEIAATDQSIVRIEADLDASALRIAEAKSAGRATASLEALQTNLRQKRDEAEGLRARLVDQLSGVTSIIRTSGLWRDLVTDDRGAAALDRLQIVVWTLVLGGVFLYTVLWDLSMPEFNGTLLALMGISSGTYIGFKLPNKTAE